MIGAGNDDATSNLKTLEDVPLLNLLGDGDDDDGTNGTGPNNGMLGGPVLQLRIKSFADVDVQVPRDSTVSHVKEVVRRALGPQSQDRYLRLICKGRLLYPDESPLSEFKVHNNDVVHAVLAAAGVREPAGGGSTRAAAGNGGTTGGEGTPGGSNRRRRGGTVVGPGGRVTRAPPSSSSNQGWNNGNGEDSSSSVGSDDDEYDNEAADAEMGRQRMGFDRLRGSGLSRQEITAIRAYFNRHVDRHIQTHGGADHQDEPDLRRRRLLFEEDWMSLQGPTSEFRLNLNQNTLLRFASVETNWRATLGTDRDFMWGFLLGFFVGFCMLVWVWMPTVPHKQKIGILTGISFQLAMNVLREDDNDEDFVDGD
jgi:hypothetical protein